jgi:protein gp37
MSDRTKIEWADATVNAINGCSITSPGCSHCYAMRLAGTRMRDHPSRRGLTDQAKTGPVWNGTVRLHEPALLQPLHWKAPRRIFWNAHGDTFHESVPDAWIDQVFAVCALTPQHTHMILTKRSARMREWFERYDGAHDDNCADKVANVVDLIAWPSARREALDRLAYWPLPNVWLGVSIEDQQRANERIPDLLATPAAIRFISAEPLLGPVDIDCPDVDWMAQPEGNGIVGDRLKIDWVIAGGESGPGARPMHPAWARALRDQCARADIAFHFKQWGEWAPICEMPDALIEDLYHPAPKHSPEASRRCKVNQCVLHADGARFDGKAMFNLPAFQAGTGAMTMFAVNKSRAGRLLDGVEHNAFPAP